MPSHKKFDSSSDEECDKLRTKSTKAVIHVDQVHSEKRNQTDGGRKSKKFASDDEEIVPKKSRRDDHEKDKLREDERSSSKHRHESRDQKRELGESGNEWKKKSGRGHEEEYRRDRNREGHSRKDRDEWRSHNRRDDHRNNRDRDGPPRREREDRRGFEKKSWDKRPNLAEVAKQRKLLWSKPGQSSTEKADKTDVVASSEAGSSSTGSGAALPKNAGLWSSAIVASGVDGQQANKFLKLMGIKNAPAAEETADEKKLREEREKQKRLLSDLDKQYELARESTHMGRGMGLGFHG